MDDFHWWLSWMSFMDDFHGWLDFAVFKLFYELDRLTDWQTDGRTLVPLKLLSLLKTTLKLNLELWVGPLDFNVSQSLNYLRLETTPDKNQMTMDMIHSSYDRYEGWCALWLMGMMTGWLMNFKSRWVWSQMKAFRHRNCCSKRIFQGAADRLKHIREENRRGSILHTITKRR